MFNNEIAICQADKGGAIIVIQPQFLTRKVREKVTDLEAYEETDSDIRPQLYSQLISLWKRGVESCFISNTEAKEVVGITLAGTNPQPVDLNMGDIFYTIFKSPQTQS